MSNVPTRHLERLLQAELEGTLSDPVLFFGHQRRHSERIGVECLSQWYPAPFVVDGVRYPTAEHWMMVHKARLFDDLDVERQILVDPSPAKAKKLGRQVRGTRRRRLERVGSCRHDRSVVSRLPGRRCGDGPAACW